MLATIVFILVLSFLVIIHEIGHLVAAKKSRVIVHEFGFGYPPRAKKLFRWWGVDFTLNWIPFGGFVRMEGEENPVADDESVGLKPSPDLVGQRQTPPPTEFPLYARPLWQRLAVIVAGATINLIFGVVAFMIVFSFMGIPTPITTARIGQIQSGSPAEKVGLPTNVDIIALEVNSTVIAIPDMETAIAEIGKVRGQQVIVVTSGPCNDTGCQESAQRFPVYVRTTEETPADQGALGIAFTQLTYRFYPWYEMPWRGSIYGIQQALLMGVEILQTVGTIGTTAIRQGKLPNELAGPVGIVDQATQSGVVNQGPLAILGLAGMLSLNLGIMNLLPIPALDGGRVVFLLLEKVIGKRRVSVVEGYANYGGFIFLVGLIVLITARDIWRIVIR